MRSIPDLNTIITSIAYGHSHSLSIDHLIRSFGLRVAGEPWAFASEPNLSGREQQLQGCSTCVLSLCMGMWTIPRVNATENPDKTANFQLKCWSSENSSLLSLADSSSLCWNSSAQLSTQQKKNRAPTAPSTSDTWCFYTLLLLLAQFLLVWRYFNQIQFSVH